MRARISKYYILYFTISILVGIIIMSCVRQPDAPEDVSITPMQRGAFILCEGLMGMNNSSLVRYDIDTKTSIKDFYRTSNRTELGDIANHIVRFGDTAFIAISTQQKIIAIRLSDGKKVGEIKLEGRRSPRRICIVNDSSAYFTDLYDNSVTEFNPKTIMLTGRKATTGPAPEGIGYYNNFIFVANSGLGDYLADEPKAGTVSVIAMQTMQEIAVIPNLPDAVEIVVNHKTGLLYAGYYNLPSLEDSLGGIVEFDINTLKETRRWRCSPKSIILTSTGDSLLFIDKNGVSLIETSKTNTQIKLLIENQNSKEFWYSLTICPYDNTIWVGNAKNYMVSGEVNIFSIENPNTKIYSIDVGVNPNTILFYK